MRARGALAACLACALVFGAGAPAGEEKCVFLLATPGSGSTSMARLLNAVPSCELSGEGGRRQSAPRGALPPILRGTGIPADTGIYCE